MKSLFLSLVCLLPLILGAQNGLYTLYGADYHQVHFTNEKSGWLIADGFVMHSIDGGNNWKVRLSVGGGKIEGENYVNYPDQYVFIDSKFFNGDYGWILAYYLKDRKNYVFVTSDYGINWKKYEVSFNEPIRTFSGVKQSFFVNSKIGYFTVSGRFYKTIDGGITWELKSTQPNQQGRTATDMYFIDENAGWYVYGVQLDANAKRFTGIAKTTDGGKTWTDLPMTTTESATCISVVNQSIWIGGWDGLIKSSDGGNSWEKVANGIFSNIQFFDQLNGLKNDSENTNTYTKRKDTYKTNDGGKTWSKVSSYAQKEYYSAELFWIIQRNGLIKYTENGNKYQTQMVGAITHVLNDIENPSESNIVAVGTYGSIIRSGDGGISWKWDSEFYQQNPFTEITEIEFFDSNNGLICGGNGYLNGGRAYVWKTGDGGITWNKCLDTTAYEGKFHEMEIIDNRCYLFNRNITYISDDFGKTWTILNTLTIGEEVYKAFFISSNLGYIISRLPSQTDGEALAMTTDGGKTWKELFRKLNLRYSDMYFIEGMGFMNFPDGKLYNTSDGGNNWNMINESFFGNSRPTSGSYFFFSNKSGVATGKGFYTTQDGGINWTLISNKTGGNARFINSSTGWVLSRTGDMSMIKYGPIILGTKPVGTITSFATSLRQFDIIEDNLKLSTYPNPFKTNITISYHLETNSDITIEVFDLMGRKVKSIFKLGVLKGRQEQLIDFGKDLKSGLYLITVKAGKQKGTVRVIGL